MGQSCTRFSITLAPKLYKVREGYGTGGEEDVAEYIIAWPDRGGMAEHLEPTGSVCSATGNVPEAIGEAGGEKEQAFVFFRDRKSFSHAPGRIA